MAIAESGTLLDKFYRRELDIRPGDALRCKVDFETSYGPDHEVLAERYRITEIIERSQKRFVGSLAKVAGEWLVMPDGNTLTEPILAPDAASRLV